MQMRRSLILLNVSLIVLLASAVLADAQSFTLEQVMSSPFPSDLIASKRGDNSACRYEFAFVRRCQTGSLNGVDWKHGLLDIDPDVYCAGSFLCVGDGCRYGFRA